MKKILCLCDKRFDEWMLARDKANQLLNDDTELLVTHYEDLGFTVDEDRTSIYDTRNNLDLQDAKLVYFTSTLGHIEEAGAVQIYLDKKGVKYVNKSIPIINNKRRALFWRWANNVPVPRSAFGAIEIIEQAFDKFGDKKYILKESAASQGMDNYLIKGKSEIRDNVEKDSAKKFILQEFIPNNGDYRILVFGGKIEMTIKRTANEGSHLNNTSQGGSVEIIPASDRMKHLAELAAQVDDVDVAGVDIIEDSTNGKMYILEVNKPPQIASGVFVDEKLGHLMNFFIREINE